MAEIEKAPGNQVADFVNGSLRFGISIFGTFATLLLSALRFRLRKGVVEAYARAHRSYEPGPDGSLILFIACVPLAALGASQFGDAFSAPGFLLKLALRTNPLSMRMIVSIIVVFLTCEIFLYQIYPRRLSGGRKRRRRIEYGRYALAAGILLVLIWWAIALPTSAYLAHLAGRIPPLDPRLSFLTEFVQVIGFLATITFLIGPLSAAATVAGSFMPGLPTAFQTRAIGLLPIELLISTITADLLYNGLIETGPHVAAIGCAYSEMPDGRSSVQVTETFANDGEATYAVWTPPLRFEQAIEPDSYSGRPHEGDWHKNARWGLKSLAGTPGTLVLKPGQRGTVNAVYVYGRDPGDMAPPLPKDHKVYCGLGNRDMRQRDETDFILNRNQDAPVVEWVRVEESDIATVSDFPSN